MRPWLWLFGASWLVLCHPPVWAKAQSRSIRWTTLQRGVRYATVRVDEVAGKGPTVRDRRLHIVHVDPARARLTALVASQLGKKPRTAGQWADQHGLVAVINLGMYLDDHRTHVGYLRVNSHVNSHRWVASYKSLLAFSPVAPGTAPVRFFDLNQRTKSAVLAPYGVVVQNLRLIRAVSASKGRGVWSEQPKRWSEAAVAVDSEGGLLFLFTRVPLSMWAFNRFVLSLPLHIVHAMHMEGGPEASLSLRSKMVRLDLSGSFETGFFPNDDNNTQWPLPNVLGVLSDGARQ